MRLQSFPEFSSTISSLLLALTFAGSACCFVVPSVLVCIGALSLAGAFTLSAVGFVVTTGGMIGAFVTDPNTRWKH